MEIRHLRYFVAVADALSFAQAARNLHVSQPALSNRIFDLEEELGFRVFDRSNKKVVLSAGGKALLPRARAVMRAFDATLHAARGISAEQSKHLRIALPSGTSRKVQGDILEQLLRENVEVNLAQADTAEQLRLLATGEIDVGLLRHPFDAHGLKTAAPLAQPLGVLMHREHPLASRGKLRLRDLKPYPLFQFQRHAAPGFYDEILEICKEHGYVPPKVLHLLRMTAAVAMNRNAVSFMPQWPFKLPGRSFEKFSWKPLQDSPIQQWVSVVCRSQEWNPLTRLAMKVIAGSLEKHEEWVPMPRPANRRAPVLKRADA